MRVFVAPWLVDMNDFGLFCPSPLPRPVDNMLAAMMSRVRSGLTATLIYLRALLYTYFSHVLECNALL